MPLCESALFDRKAILGGVMTRFLNDILLFYCMAAFATGLVLAAARLFI
jgi:hypothetical protein